MCSRNSTIPRSFWYVSALTQHNTIDSVLQRGEDLDKLVEKSGSLSQQSKMFYKSARKQSRSSRSPRLVLWRDVVHSGIMSPSTMTEAPDAGPSVAAALHEDADGLFARYSVKQMEAYSAELGRVAHEKQHAARALVGDRYQELLGVAKTVVNMQGSLASLQTSLQGLQRNVGAYSASARTRAHALEKPAGGANAPSLAVGACVLVVLDAPALAESAMRRGALLLSAWCVCIGRGAMDYLEKHAPDAAVFSECSAAERSRLRAHTALVERATQALGAASTDDVCQALAALIVLGEQTPSEALAYFHAQRYAQIRGVLRAESGDALNGMQAVAACYTSTLAQTDAVFRSHTGPTSLLETLRNAAEPGTPSRFFALGAPLLHAGPRASAVLYGHLPLEITTYTLPPPTPVPAADVDEASTAWADRVCAKVDALAALLAPVDDLDAVAECRAALHTTMQTHRERHSLRALDALHTRFAALLDQRAVELVQQTLAAATKAFASAADAALAAQGDEPLFPPRKSDALDAVVGPLATQLTTAARHTRTYGRAAIEPLSRACDQVASHLAKETDDAAALGWLLHLCTHLQQRVDGLDEVAPFLARLAEVRATLAQRWTAVHVARAVAAGDAAPRDDAVPSRALVAALRTLGHAHLRLGTDAPRDTLPRLDEAWRAKHPADAPFLDHLGGASAPPEIAAAAARLRLVLAPWTLNARSASTAPRTHGLRLARVAPRFVPL